MIESLYEPFRHWSEKGAIWIYSDPHFNDSDTALFDPNRPSDDELVTKINSKVGRHDTLILLGDIGDISYISKLKGYKVLICGNHDIGASKYKRIKTDISDNHLFDEVYSGPLIISEKIILSHEPVNLPYMFNIHGHIHDRNYKGDINHLNCVAETIDYTPVSFNKLVKSGFTSKIDSIHRITIDRATLKKTNNKQYIITEEKSCKTCKFAISRGRLWQCFNTEINMTSCNSGKFFCSK